MAEVDITGLDKAELLAALFNNASAQGMGFKHPGVHGEMSREDAQAIIVRLEGSRLNFDYVRGRKLRVDLTGDTVETWLYNRDSGEGAAEEAIEAVRRGEKVFTGIQVPKTALEESAMILAEVESLVPEEPQHRVKPSTLIIGGALALVAGLALLGSKGCHHDKQPEGAPVPSDKKEAAERGKKDFYKFAERPSTTATVERE